MRFLHSPLTLIKAIAIYLFCLFQPAMSLATENTLIITNAWIQEAPPNTKIMAGYMSLTNNSSEPVTIRSITSPSFRKIESHRTLYKDGIAKMSSLEKLTIPEQGSITFEPGGYHLMMFSPEKPLLSGDTVTLSFQLDNHPVINQHFLVRREPAIAGTKGHHH